MDKLISISLEVRENLAKINTRLQSTIEQNKDLIRINNELTSKNEQLKAECTNALREIERVLGVIESITKQ
ncbi:MAG: hypothetical protein SFT91_05570 [Rickettsiaceae bacterium]|nr:hypothetical protein [Rickettsiaceae bacterium]